MTQGSNWAHPVNGQRGQTHQRHDAGEAGRGGEARIWSSVDQIDGGDALRTAGELAHRVVVAVGPGEAGVVAGIDLGDRRSSGELGVDATMAVAMCDYHLRRLRDAVSTMGACLRPNGHRNVAGDELLRRRGSVFKGATATARNRGGEEGNSVRELTAETLGWSACSEDAWR